MKIFKQKSSQFTKAVDSFSESLKRPGGLFTLKELSNSIPSKLPIEIIEFRFNTINSTTSKFNLRIEADSFDSIEEFKSALNNNKSFSKVEEKSSESKPGSDLKIAVFEAEYNPL